MFFLLRMGFWLTVVCVLLPSSGAKTRETCDYLVRLPQQGTVESLNVSVASGMLLYEAVRQRISPAKRS